MNDIEILEEFLEDYKIAEEVLDGDVICAIENLIQRNKDLEQIEKEHKEENGRLRDRVKELEKTDLSNSKIIANMSERHFHDRKKIRDLEMLNEGWKIKLKEIVDECIPKKENIITKELEYTPNTNDNSYLTQRILELLEESEK